MFRAPDPWELDQAARQPLKCGFKAGLLDHYELGDRLGKGGFGEVRIVKSKATGHEYACKSILKRVEIPNVLPIKQQQHLENIKREAMVLRKLRGTLNVVHLEDVFEDDNYVHIVMELCKGGELLSRIGKKHYSERTVASYMRAVLRTLAQCHHHRILHRDIKPGNFMLLHDADDAPIKAIDFGLAVFFKQKELPRRDLGLEGTAHYMAPENLSSEVYPASDVWAAGIMAHVLLSGRFPFDDWKSPNNPALSLVWRSILTEEPKFNGPAWADVSDGAKDFIRYLLNKDPKARPTAKQALEHPWIQGKAKQRTEGKALSATVVQRLQHFGTENAFKRTVLDMIANELLQRHTRAALEAAAAPNSAAPPRLDAATSTVPMQVGSPARSVRAGDQHSQAPGSPVVPTGAALSSLDNERSVRRLAASSLIRSLADKSHTVHASGDAYKVLRSRSLAAQGTTTGGVGRTSSFDQLPQDVLAAAMSFSKVPSPPGGSFHGGSSLAPVAEEQQQGAGGADGAAALPLPPLGTLPLAAAGRAPSGGGASGREGSGHALQHYAFLLGVGERSFHGVRSGAAGGSSGGATAAAAPGSPAGVSASQPSSPFAPNVMTRAASVGSFAAGGSSHGGGADGMLRLLGSVHRQRMEHRKLQRLALDTSGRAQRAYAQAAAGSPLINEGLDEEDDSEAEGEAEGVDKAALRHVSTGLSSATTPHAHSRAPSDVMGGEAAGAEANQKRGRDARDGTGSGSGAELSLAAKVGNALLKPVKTLLRASGSGTAAEAQEQQPSFSRLSQQAAAADAAADETGPALARSSLTAQIKMLHEQESGRGGEGVVAAAAAAAAAAVGEVGVAQEERRHGRGAYAQLMATSTTSTATATPTPQVLPAIRTVKAHKPPPGGAAEPPAVAPAAAAAAESAAKPQAPDAAASAEDNSIPAQLARLGAAAPATTAQQQPAAAEGGAAGAERVPKSVMFEALGQLIGSQSQLAELEAVLSRLQYDTHDELSYEQISEGLQWLGYRLEPSEVEVLLREVALGGGGSGMSTSQFIASQVDWREFQANHREEWLNCLRSTFESLDRHKTGRLQADDIIALLHDKLPEDEVNLAVQETLMDAALGTEGLDFEDFVRLVREGDGSSVADSPAGSVEGSLRRGMSLDLYDSRLVADLTTHSSKSGGGGAAALLAVGGGAV